MANRTRILCIGSGLDRFVDALRKTGYDVTYAPTLHPALALLRLFPPAAIVLQSDDSENLMQQLWRKNCAVPISYLLHLGQPPTIG